MLRPHSGLALEVPTGLTDEITGSLPHAEVAPDNPNWVNATLSPYCHKIARISGTLAEADLAVDRRNSQVQHIASAIITHYENRV